MSIYMYVYIYIHVYVHRYRSIYIYCRVVVTDLFLDFLRLEKRGLSWCITQGIPRIIEHHPQVITICGIPPLMVGCLNGL